ncbi:MAG: hypothetical protein QOE90_3375 [Thermoplasmata archaeon]|jgi:sarcosine oxidase subunit beta|nr:hypothetical protein [Thermoplasmata archaeon]
MRVAVVGAGVMGTSVAYHLAKGGAEVVLVEERSAGSGTSSRGAGLVCEGMWHAGSLALVRRSMALLDELERETKEAGWAYDVHHVGSTTLVPERLAGAAERMAAFQRAHGADARVMTPEDVAKLPRHQGVRLDDVALAVHYPRDLWALPRMYCEIRAMTLEMMGREQVARPARLVRSAGRVALDGVDADAVVLAAGVWTRALLREVGLDAPLQAYRTQAQRFAAPAAHEVPILHDAVQGFYLRPHWPGQLLVGDGTTTTPEDPDRYQQDADATFVAASRRRLARRLPAFAEAKATDAWAGVDAATPDRLLLAGPHPDAPEVWLLAGGNGHGFMRAPAAGEALAAKLLRKQPLVDISAFDPGRFAGRMSTDFPIREGYTLEP